MANPSADERRAELVELYHHLRDHHDCPLKAGRRKLVFGSGNADADLMFVGEAPGAREDELGLPFVGPAGQLLDQLLGEIGLERKDVFISNVLMCRPPGNRDPSPEEVEECKPFLKKRIELIEPKVICTLGNYATKLLTGSQRGITKVHGQPQQREIAGRAVTLYPLFHPAAALRSTSVLDLLRADVHQLPELIAAHVPEPEAPEPAADEEQLGLFG
ncbi:MAG: uracil-DNA glycosylase [Thermoleophilaceae bacterium]